MNGDRLRLRLAEPYKPGELAARLREKLPAIADRLEEVGASHDRLTRVVATRRFGREFVAAHPEVTGPVELDCQWVECISPPVVYELLAAWPEATFVNGNEDVEATVDFVRQRLEERRSGSVASACGHPQKPPTDQEIDGCPEIIVRNCPVCASGLWWNIDQWRKF